MKPLLHQAVLHLKATDQRQLLCSSSPGLPLCLSAVCQLFSFYTLGSLKTIDDDMIV